jgi:hypothetical protein
MQPILANSESGHEPRIEGHTCGRPLFGRLSLLTSLGLCISGVGCRDGVTTWSGEALSPDGKWLATAQSQQWSGPGTAYDATTVSLKEVKASRAARQILLFSHQFATMNLKMEWVTATHLDVSYGPSASPGDQVRLNFQIAKISGIDISVRELSSNGSIAR